MDFLVLTKVGGILSPFATLIGWILNAIYKFLDFLNVGNVGLAIILMTIIINLLMLPLTVKQQKFTRLNAAMQPEIMKIREKYTRRADAQANAEMQQEMNKVYEKYGTSATGGCLQLIIQLPIIYALFSVIRSIPAYIEPVHDMYEPIANGIAKTANANDICTNLIQELGLRTGAVDAANPDTIIDMLNVLRVDQWDSVKAAFASSQPVLEAIDANLPNITNVNNFLGLNIANYPTTDGWWPGVLIPIISAVTQFINSKVSQARNDNNSSGGMAASLKTMLYVMPIISMVICFSLQIGVGLYWIARAVVLTIITIIINKMIDKKGLDKLVEESKAKADRKRERKIKKQGGKAGEFDTIANTSLKNVGEYKRPKTISELAASGKNVKDYQKDDSKDAPQETSSEEEAKVLGVTDVKDQNDQAIPGVRSISEIAHMLDKKK